MSVRKAMRRVALPAILAVLATLLVGTPFSAAEPSAGRYIVVARSAADYGGLRAKAVGQGARVVHDIPQLKALAITAPKSVRDSLAADSRTLGVAADRVQKITAEPGGPARRRPACAAPRA